MFPSMFNLAMLTTECCQVISLRLMRLSSGGPEAFEEARLMVAEKIEAAHKAAERMVAGDSADSVVERYRELVQANAGRLSGASALAPTY